MMGSAAAYDLATTHPDDEVVLADINFQAATQSAKAIGPNVRALRLDVNNQHDLVAALQGSNALISAVSYSVNYQIARGVMPPEVCVPGELMIQELGKRRLKTTKRITETWS